MSQVSIPDSILSSTMQQLLRKEQFSQQIKGALTIFSLMFHLFIIAQEYTFAFHQN